MQFCGVDHVRHRRDGPCQLGVPVYGVLPDLVGVGGEVHFGIFLAIQDAALFREVWGPGSLDCANDVQGVYERIGRSVAAYERSPEVSPFRFW